MALWMTMTKRDVEIFTYWRGEEDLKMMEEEERVAEMLRKYVCWWEKWCTWWSEKRRGESWRNCERSLKVISDKEVVKKTINKARVSRKLWGRQRRETSCITVTEIVRFFFRHWVISHRKLNKVTVLRKQWSRWLLETTWRNFTYWSGEKDLKMTPRRE